MKAGTGKPVVGATLVVARSQRQPVFIPLCGLRNAMVILRSAATKNLQSLPHRRRDFLSQSLPRRADRGRQNGIVAMTQPRLPVIPSAARNLKSITTRPDSQCHVYVMTNSGKQRENSPGRLSLETEILDSSTPLRCAQNDSKGVAFSSIESGAIVKCLSLSALGDRLPIPISPAGGETTHPNLSPAGGRDTERGVFAIQLTETEQLQLHVSCSS